jgi:hypothetical protein
MQRAVVGLGIACAMLLALAWPAQASRGIQIGRGSSQTIGVSGVLTLTGGGFTVTCSALLSISTDGTIYKVPSLPSWESFVQPSSLSNCTFPMTPGTQSVNTDILLRYLGFTGGLPSIAGIELEALHFGITVGVLGVAGCLYTNDVRTRVLVNAATGALTGVEFSSATLVTSPGGPCPASWTMRGILSTFLAPPPSVTLV